jgi:hypothetical protein
MYRGNMADYPDEDEEEDDEEDDDEEDDYEGRTGVLGNNYDSDGWIDRSRAEAGLD